MHRITHTQKLILQLGIGMVCLFAFFFFMAHTKQALVFEFKKAKIDDKTKPNLSLQTITDTRLLTQDSIPKPLKNERVLLIGDSQLESLRKPVLKACASNGHALVASILWYGSSTQQWSQSDTLSYYLKKFKPSYVILAIGLNELFVNDMDKRKENIIKIQQTLKTAHVRYFWIGPAAWKADKGITALLDTLNKPYFYPSHRLTIARAKDKRHPSHIGARVWFDSVAVKMSALKQQGLCLTEKKDTIVSIKESPFILLKPSYN